MPLANAHGTVLLVEDQEIDAEIALGILERAGYQATWTADPAEAVALLESTPFDIVLCDYMMPKMNGLQVLRRARFQNPQSVRMLLTGIDDFDIAVEAINRGEVYRFLRKPIDERELVVSLRMAEERLGMAREIERLTRELKKRDAALAALRGGKG